MKLSEEFTTRSHLFSSVSFIVVFVSHEQKDGECLSLEPPSAIEKGFLIANVIDCDKIGITIVAVEHTVQVVDPRTGYGAKL